MPNRNKRVKENLKLFVTGVYIALAIALTQIISSAVQKIDTVNSFFVFNFIFIIFLYGFFIFILIKFSKPFRNFLFRMFGVQSENPKEDPPHNNEVLIIPQKTQISKERLSIKDALKKYLDLILLAVLISIVIQGAYDAFFYSMKGDVWDAFNSLYAMGLVVGIIIAIILWLYVGALLESRKTKPEEVDSNEIDKEETESEKVKRISQYTS